MVVHFVGERENSPLLLFLSSYGGTGNKTIKPDWQEKNQFNMCTQEIINNDAPQNAEPASFLYFLDNETINLWRNDRTKT